MFSYGTGLGAQEAAMGEGGGGAPQNKTKNARCAVFRDMDRPDP